MRCRYARRKGTSSERWKVTLYWQGRKFTRYRYDDRVPLSSEFLASRLAHAINSEIERLGPGFSPKSWFAPSSYELRLDNYARAWLDRRAPDLAPESYRLYRTAIEKHIIPLLGTVDIRGIKRGHLEDFLHRLPPTLSPTSRKLYLAVIKGILHDAYQREDITRVPPFPTVRIPEREIKWLNLEQQHLVIEATPASHRAIFLVMAYYGLRPAEARALQWDAVDYEAKTITIRRTFSREILRETTKTHRTRVLPLTPEIETILKPIRGISGFVFRDGSGGAYTGNKLRDIWNAAVRRSGVKHVTLYEGIRHSSASSKLHEAGWDMENLRQLLGHTSVETTRRYARAGTEDLRKKLER